ncbi:MAG: DUF1800 domain-containing protein [Pseudomonadota bacterium]
MRHQYCPKLIATAAALLISAVPAWAQDNAALPGPASMAVWHATSRLGYGPTPALVAAAMPSPRAWALHQVDEAHAASLKPPLLVPEVARIDVPLGELVRDVQAERVARQTLRDARPLVTVSGATVTSATPGAADTFSRDISQQAAAWRLMACSDPNRENPLLARMTEFWFNHLNVFVGKGTVRPFVGHYAIHVIRANALGRFEDLLLASARHPAMLLYLDQAQSNNRGLNENYARELMELHTLGVNGGYTQNDVRELARILTGWTLNIRNGQGFLFSERLHDKGEKVLLGQRYAYAGMAEGEEAMRALARHPATARRIAWRLATFFVADAPPVALVDRLAASFLRSEGDMRAVLRTLIESPEFWASEQTLFKTPMDFACSALTVAGGVKDRRDVVQALTFLAQAGQPMHGWQTPDGYRTDAATWLAPEALTRRADYAMALAERMPDPAYLQTFLSAPTRERTSRETGAMRTGLLLASPDFMRK